MLGAALAGLSLMPTEGEAATYYESTDFGNSLGVATDLTSTFGNFLIDGGVVGSIQPGGADFNDFIKVNVAPNMAASINFSASSTVANPFFGIGVWNSAGSQFAANYLATMPTPGTTYQGVLSFTTPADGIILFGTNQETGPATINYSIGAVPEPTSALLAAAGIAASALVRRRNRA